MAIEKQHDELKVRLEGGMLEPVTRFVYLGELITEDGRFIHSFIHAISIAPLQVLYYSEALPTTARILYRCFTPKRTCVCR